MKTDICMLLKFPEAGHVKTRLAASTSTAFACELYRFFVEELVLRLRQSQLPFTLCYDPKIALERYQKWLPNIAAWHAQENGDLGARLQHIVESKLYDGADHVILLGSDCPDLFPGDFRRFTWQTQQHSATIGPAEDGGYYLMGLSKTSYSPNLFNNIQWSSDTVLNETLCAADAENIPVKILETRQDIDTLQDLRTLFLRHQHGPYSKSKALNHYQNSPYFIK